jgi:hypothetical protein
MNMQIATGFLIREWGAISPELLDGAGDEEFNQHEG